MAAPPARPQRATTVRATPDHGTRARYVHRSLACRDGCPNAAHTCRQANTEYIRGYRTVARAGWNPRTWTQLALDV